MDITTVVAFKLDKILKQEDHLNKVYEQMYSFRLAFFTPIGAEQPTLGTS
ncbi:hypothetical protein Q8I65_19985 [Paenibacillus ottowii]|nr:MULTISPECIES: hypothetical protein [Paenibacillus]MDP1512456.1 hypothetical protein [Paenibacillus ottowii]